MFIKAEIWTVARTSQGTAVLLRFSPPSGRCVPVYVSSAEAQAVLSGMGDGDNDPSLAQDLLVELAGALNVVVDAVEIYSREDQQGYRGRIILSGSTNKFTLEGRPADALAIAVRTGADIFLADAVIDDAIQVNLTEENLPDEIEIRRLREKLRRCVAEEEYEKAAVIRDRLSDIGRSQ